MRHDAQADVSVLPCTSHYFLPNTHPSQRVNEKKVQYDIVFEEGKKKKMTKETVLWQA